VSIRAEAALQISKGVPSTMRSALRIASPWPIGYYKMKFMATDQVIHHKRLKHFERLVKAYRVRPENRGWIVKKVGGKSRTFSDKDHAIAIAKKKAALEYVGVLVFEGGHVSEIS
jgi:uncharacterized protein DUF2188